MAATYGGPNIKAWHTNMPIAFGRPNPTSGQEPSEDEKLALEGMKKYSTKGNGYYIEQATQPQTIGYSLSDSPVGLLSWIYEKLASLTDGYAWDDDEGMLLLGCSFVCFFRSC